MGRSAAAGAIRPLSPAFSPKGARGRICGRRGKICRGGRGDLWCGARGGVSVFPEFTGGVRMLGSIRKRTGSLLVKGLLGLLVISFALWGIGDIFQAPRDSAVAEVGGVGIQASALQAEFTRTVENLRQRLGLDAEQARAFGALDDALDRLIDREAVRQEAAAIGIGAGDDDVLGAIERNTVFHNVAGRFDKAVYNAVLFDNRLTPETYEQSVRLDLMRAQLVDSLAAGAHPPAAAVRRLQSHRQQQRVAEALTLSAADLEPPEPDLAALQDYFDAHRAVYMAPEYRRIAAVILRPADFLDEVDVSDEALREDYADRLDEFVVPARRAVDQMVLPDRESADEARRRLAAGEDFYALGAELLGLAEADMDQGLRTADELASEELGAAVFAAAVGEAAGPVETPFGWAVAQAREEAAGTKRSFESVAETLRLERKIALAQDLVAELGDAFEDERAGGASLEESARAVGAAPLLVGPVDRLGRAAYEDAPGDAPPPVAAFLEQAFTAALDEESPLHDTDDGTYYAMRVDSIAPPAERRLDEVRAAAVADWQADWRRERAVEQAAEIAGRLRAGEAAADVAADAGAGLQTTASFTRDSGGVGDGLGAEFVAAAFALEDGGVSEPVAEGDLVHVARLVEILDIDAENPDEGVRDRIAGQFAASQIGDIMGGYTEALRLKHGAAVNRGAVDRFFGN